MPVGDDALDDVGRLRPGIGLLAAEMAKYGSRRDAPVREVMGMMGDRWSTLIVLVLGTGEWRHSELRRVLAWLSAEQDISQRVMTLKLRTLQRNGFVERIAINDLPPRVSYRLTHLGMELHREIRRVIDWVNANSTLIGEARENFSGDC